MAFYQSENLWIGTEDGDIAVLRLDVQDRAVNVLTRQVLAELDEAFDRIQAEESIRYLYMRSGKPGNFCAGADVRELEKITKSEEATALSQQGQELFGKLAGLRPITVAIVNGACLGGGLELAMTCDYRAIVDHPKVQLGLPEVELGLIPAWGGTQRLPRIVGLERTLQMILGGRRLRAKQAMQWGLGDWLVASSDQELDSLLADRIKVELPKLPLRTWRQRLVESTPLGRGLIYKTMDRFLQRRVPDDMPAPWEAYAAIRLGLKHGLEAGLGREREAAGRLFHSMASRNLIRLFLQGEQTRKIQPAEPGDEPPIRNVGVVGAGTMGAGIAQLAALRGCEVDVQEVNDTALGIGMLQIVGLFERASQRGVIALADVPKRLAAVHGSTQWKRFADLDLVIEAIVEDLDQKKKTFREIERRVSPSTIIATNTSSLCVEQLQEGLEHPGRVAGLHFFNPVHKMPLVEVVRSQQTSQETAERLLRFAAALGKTPVLVKDSAGFLVNRVLMPYLNEAVTLVSEGMKIAQVDAAMRKFGMPAGPLELLDQIGLDIAAHIAGAMKDVYAKRITPHSGFGLLAEKGWKGQKSGTGFYRWRRRRKPNHLAENALQLQAKEQGIRPLAVSSAQDRKKIAQERMVTLMINEAAMCLGEELVGDASALNLALVMGTGWAPHRGGPMHYADDRGWADIAVAMEKLRDEFGERFEPCAELRRLTAKEKA